MARHVEERAEDLLFEQRPVADERPDEPPVRILVRPEPSRRPVQAPVDERRGAVQERMRECNARVHPLEPMLGERQPAEERRARPERVEPGADVVAEAWQRELLRPRAAADSRGRLAHEHRAPRLREHDRRREPVRACPDDDRVVGHVVPRYATPASSDVRASRTISRAITRRWTSFVPS